MLVRSPERRGLYDPSDERSSCGVGFLTRKDGTPSHELIEMAHESRCLGSAAA